MVHINRNCPPELIKKTRLHEVAANGAKATGRACVAVVDGTGHVVVKTFDTVAYKLGDAVYRSTGIPRLLPEAVMGSIVMFTPMATVSLLTATAAQAGYSTAESVISVEDNTIKKSIKESALLPPSAKVRNETIVAAQDEQDFDSPELPFDWAGYTETSVSILLGDGTLAPVEDAMPAEGCVKTPNGKTLCEGITPVLSITSLDSLFSENVNKIKYLQSIESDLGVRWQDMVVKATFESKLGTIKSCGAGKYCGMFQIGQWEANRYCPPGYSRNNEKQSPYCAVNLNRDYHKQANVDFKTSTNYTKWQFHNQGPGSYHNFLAAEAGTALKEKYSGQFVNNVCNNIPVQYNQGMCEHKPLLDKSGKQLKDKKGKPRFAKRWTLGNGYGLADMTKTYKMVWTSELKRIGGALDQFAMANSATLVASR